MAFHPELLSVTRSIGEACRELERPIESVQWLTWKSGDEKPDARKIFSISFHLLAVYLSNIDGRISAKEIDFIRDINGLFSVDKNNMSSEKLIPFYEQSLRESPEAYKFQMPVAISYVEKYDQINHTNLAEMARSMFFRFANAFIKADGSISSKETAALTQFKELLYPDPLNTAGKIIEPAAPPPTSAQKGPFSRSLDDLLTELNTLIGLQAVKNDVMQLVNFLKVQQMRQAKGMPPVPISRHLVFYGNPGTGKTTVARLIAQIYNALGVISKGHLAETDRSGLVAGYVGQTAIKVQEVVTRSLGGVLFIDEAYSLTGEGQDYGREAIDTLIKLMEDNRDDLVVIVAGYTEKMNKFLLSNPGLKSRFTKYFFFDDYSPPQLVTIFEHFANASGFYLTPEAVDKLLGIFTLLSDVKDETFGNARLARNVFERAIGNQANRIISLTEINEQLLSRLEAVDIPGDVDIHAIK